MRHRRNLKHRRAKNAGAGATGPTGNLPDSWHDVMQLEEAALDALAARLHVAAGGTVMQRRSALWAAIKAAA